MKKTLIIFFLWLLIVNVFAVFALNRFNLSADTAYTWIDENAFSQQQEWNLISLHTHWDSFWYLDIAENGYSFNGPDNASNIVFFPLYPFLILAVGSLFGGNFAFAGWMLSILFLLLALFYLFKLVKEFHPEINPHLPLILLLIFPTAFFLNSIYTESLFLFLSLGAFYYARKGSFLLAGIFGFFASLTRVTGILLIIPLLWEYLLKHNFNLLKALKPNILALGLIPLGTLGFFTYHYLRFGNFLLFFQVEKWWGRAFTLEWGHFILSTNPAIVNFVLDILFVVFALIIIYFVFRKLRTSYGLYMLATLLVALGTGTLMSVGRYLLPLFPIYIIAATIKNEHLRQTWTFVSILLFALYTILFVNNYWAG